MLSASGDAPMVLPALITNTTDFDTVRQDRACVYVDGPAALRIGRLLFGHRRGFLPTDPQDLTAIVDAAAQC
jgi:hypothetical protein